MAILRTAPATIGLIVGLGLDAGAPRDDAGWRLLAAAQAGDDDDDDGPRGAADDDDGPPVRRRAAPGIPGPSRSLSREESDRARRAEISAANLTQADLGRLQQLGFQVIRSRRIVLFGNKLTLRLRTPERLGPPAALQVARQVVPSGIFDLSHLCSPGQGAGVYARDKVRISAAAGCGRGLGVGLVDSGVSEHPTLRGARMARKRGGSRAALHPGPP